MHFVSVTPLFGMFEGNDTIPYDNYTISWELMLKFLKLCFSLVSMLNDSNSSQM